MKDNNYSYDNIMLKGIIITVCSIFVGVIIFVSAIRLWVISPYDSIVNAKQNVKLAEANVENMLQNRLTLIPDLVKVVEKYSDHEEQVFADIADARQNLMNSIDSGDLAKMSEADQNLSVAINNLLAYAEQYPTLTAGTQYTALMDSIAESVNRITIARTEYNEAVATYNKKITTFRGAILAKIFGFEEFDEYKADKAAYNSSMVNFSK